jgi:hypothetical protein
LKRFFLSENYLGLDLEVSETPTPRW